MKILALLALTIGVAQAQETTLTYQGSLMTGTTATFNPGGVLTTEPFTGAYSISLVFQPLSQPSYFGLVSYSFSVVGPDPININVGPQPLGTSGDFQTSFCGAPGQGCVIPTFSNGAMTGATIDLSNSGYHSDSSGVSIGAAGDSFSFIFGDNNGLCGGGSTPPTSFIPNCRVFASDVRPGVWSVNGVPQTAPEMDPTSAASGLTLLLGSLAVLRSRRKSAFVQNCA
jgi:LPXTG-motif cell wall-anchored protein